MWGYGAPIGLRILCGHATGGLVYPACVLPHCRPPPQGYPTLKVFYKGEEVKVHRGPRDKDSLKTFIEETAAEVTTEA